MPTGYTQVSASALKDATGTLVANATISFTPVSNNGKNISFLAGGGGQTISTSVSAVVTAGAFTIQLADTSLTTPVNVGYAVAATDNLTGDHLLGLGYGCFQPTGATYNFDTYVPNLAAQVTVLFGPQGLSAYQLYQQGGGELSQAAWIASLQGKSGTSGANGIASLPALAGMFAKTPLGTQNLINSAAMQIGYVSPGGSTPGGFTAAMNYFYATDYIIANSGGQMVCNNASDFAICYYDQNLTFVSADTTNYAANTPFTVPNSAAFLRLTLTNNTDPRPTAMLVFGTLLPSAYEPATIDFGFVGRLEQLLGSATPSDSLTQYVQAAITGSQPSVVNIFDPTRVTVGTCYDSAYGGVFTSISQFDMSDYMPVTPGATYTYWVNTCWGGGSPSGLGSTFGAVFYDFNKNLLPATWIACDLLQTGSTFVAPSGAAFVRVPICALGSPSAVPSAMILTGSVPTRPAVYIPFAQQPSTTQTRSPWYGKKLGIWGDSYSAFNIWQQAVSAYHGMTIVFQDARSARPIGGNVSNSIFEVYGGTATGTNLQATGTAANLGPGYGTGAGANDGTFGNTIAQDIASVDLMIIQLGGNDVFGEALGTIADGPTVASTYGYIQAALQGIQAAKPQMRIAWITPWQYPDPTVLGGGLTRAQQVPGINTAIEAVCAQYGVPVINMHDIGGLNQYSAAWIISTDNIHPDTLGWNDCYIPVVALALNSISPLT